MKDALVTTSIGRFDPKTLGFVKPESESFEQNWRHCGKAHTCAAEDLGIRSYPRRNTGAIALSEP